MYPLYLNIAERLCVVIGGGTVAERKVRGVLAAGGRVRVVSPTLTKGLTELAERQIIEWRCTTYRREELDNAFLVFAATNSVEVQKTVHLDAVANGLLINVADAPERCDFQVPATLRRGDLTIAIATNGKSPAVAAMVKQRLDRSLGEEWGLLIALAAMVREKILAQEDDSDAIKRLFQQLLDDALLDWLRERQWDKVRHHLERVLGRQIDFDPEILTKGNP